jgi:hypothetical protein
MTDFTSNSILIHSTDKAIYTFLSDFNNFEKLLPEQVTQWKSTTESCSFTIQGMADLALVKGESKEFGLITYKSIEPSPFVFHLQFMLVHDTSGTIATCNLGAELSPMIKLMVSRPLQNFVNLLVEKLKEHLER